MHGGEIMMRVLIALLTLAALIGGAWTFYGMGLTTGRDEIRLAWAKQRATDVGATLELVKAIPRARASAASHRRQNPRGENP